MFLVLETPNWDFNIKWSVSFKSQKVGTNSYFLQDAFPDYVKYASLASVTHYPIIVTAIVTNPFPVSCLSSHLSFFTTQYPALGSRLLFFLNK